MLKKYNKTKAGPSWAEVVLGAVLAVILGVVLGAAYQISRPVAAVTSIPKDAPAGAVYFIAGSTISNRTTEGDIRHSFVGGETVVVGEGEINAFLSSIAKPSAPAPSAKPGDKDKAAPPAADAKFIDVGTLNARLHDNKITLGAPVNVSAYGVAFSVICQATGTFVKDGSQFVFDPDTIYVGGCQVQRLLFLKGLIMKKLLLVQTVPDDVAAAWSKLADVSIEGSKLRLKAP